jgi:hypothetical protein
MQGHDFPAWVYRLSEEFDVVVEEMRDREAARLHTTLGHWALPTDRHLPRTLLGYTLAELIETPFVQLVSTPGVGPKKLDMLLKVLKRAARTSLTPGSRNGHKQLSENYLDGRNGPNEIAWERYRRTVAASGLGCEPMGRFVASLRDLPRWLWQTPFATYFDHELAELRGLRRLGDKKIAAVFETFQSIHQTLAALKLPPHLSADLTPRFVEPVQGWILRKIQAPFAISVGELRHNLITPTLEQLGIDGGERLASMAAFYLSPEMPTVRAVADHFRLGRSWVYQMQVDAATIMNVRWPIGRVIVPTLRVAMAGNSEPPAVDLLDAAVTLLFSHSDHEASSAAV